MEEKIQFKKVAAKVLKVLEQYQDEKGNVRTPFLTEEEISVGKKAVKCLNIRSRAGALEKHKELIEDNWFVFNERV